MSFRKKDSFHKAILCKIFFYGIWVSPYAFILFCQAGGVVGWRAPGDVVCLLGKNAGAGAPAGVARRLNPGTAVSIRSVTGWADGGAASGSWDGA